MRNSSARFKSKWYTAFVASAAWMLSGAAMANEIPYERVIDLKGTTNTRDIGGYAAGEQQIIRSGKIIRSENLSRLTEADFEKLEEIGVKTVIDLRTEKEHAKKPTVWIGDQPPQFYHFPVGHAENEWFKQQRSMVKKNRFTEEQSLELMKNGYRMILEEGTDSYRQLMDVVMDESNWPILIHCNAGKDRAGIATTLILEALGVERDVIMDEFLMTNDIGRSQEKAELMARESKKYRRMGKTPNADAWLPIVGVHEEMLETYYSSVEERYGSMDAYLEELGVDTAARNALSESLVAEPSQLVMGE
jgi:protein-tyrosine phosphatase